MGITLLKLTFEFLLIILKTMLNKLVSSLYACSVWKRLLAFPLLIIDIFLLH